MVKLENQDIKIKILSIIAEMSNTYDEQVLSLVSAGDSIDYILGLM